MIVSRPSLPAGQSQPLPGSPRGAAPGRRQPGCRSEVRAARLPRAGTLWSCLLAAFVLSACGKKPDPVPVAAPAVPPPPAQLTPTDTDLLATLNPAATDTASDADEPTALEREARRVMRLYPDKNAQELLNTPEVNPKLAEALKGLAADPQLQAAINKSVDLAAHFKGLDGPPGSFKLGLDTTVYDDARTERMLSAVLSGQPRPIVQFLADELGEASFEFSFTNADKTTNGISVERNPTPPAPPANTDPD